jgi:protein-S-isoprenylcysteine O-methyltransferase Ste14
VLRQTPHFYQYAFAAMWVSWALYWWARSRGVKSDVRRETAASRLSYLILVVLAFALLWGPDGRIPVLDARFLPAEGVPIFAPLGAAVCLTGLLFTAWAREHLGRNWSGTVTVKKDHELITTGPYAWVRHPIYTGLLLAALGQAVARGQWSGLIAVGILLAAFWRKSRLEEIWIRGQFGSLYEEYSRRVSALIPFIL